MAESIPHLSAVGIRRRIRDGDLSVTEVVEAHLERIRAHNDRTNAFITVTEDLARAMAADAEAAIEDGTLLGPLHGVPVAVKEIYDLAGFPTTWGSELLAEDIAEEDAAMISRIKEAGAIIVGKTNVPEFAMASVTENRLVGATGTPFDPERAAGGSSGGAGAAVGDALVPLAQGSDAGGSIRIPASFCGVYGIKPTYGVVPNMGRPNAFSSHSPFISQGPMARSVEDAALLLEVMAGQDRRDPFSAPVSTDFRAATEQPIDDLRIAYSPDFGTYPVDPAVRAVLDEAITTFETAGATVERMDPNLGHDRHEIQRAYIEFVTLLFQALFDGLEEEGHDPRGEDKHLLRDNLVDLIERAPETTLRKYKKAEVVRTRVFDGMQDLFEDYDLLVTATNGVVAFPHDDPPTEVDGVEVEPGGGWVLTVPYNLTGHPAGSIPAGFVDGLPVGMQLGAPRFGDADVLAASATLERRRPWHDRYPR